MDTRCVQMQSPMTGTIVPRPLKCRVIECHICRCPTNTTEIYEILEPGQDGMYGIYYCKEHEQDARIAMLKYCKQKNIYPVTEELITALCVNNGEIAVSRSNGSIQHDWVYGPMAHILLDGRFGIVVSRLSENVHKTLPFEDFIKLNPSVPFDVEELKALFVLTRSKMYNDA